MKKYLPIAGISLFFGALCFVLTSSLLYASLIFALFALSLFIGEFFFVRKQMEKDKKNHGCFLFTRSFLLSLIASNSYDEAYRAAEANASKELLLVSETFKERTSKEKIYCLYDYFKMDEYRLFLSILDLYETEGGDIALLADPYLMEATQKEKDLIRKEGAKKKSLIEFSSLLFMGSLIIGFLRYGLSSFYEELLESLPYKVCSLLYFVFTAFAVFMYCKSYSEISFQEAFGKEKNEKIKKTATKGA